MQYKNLTTALFLGVSVLAAGFSPDANAVQTVYPAIACERWSGGGGTTWYGGAGRVYNTSATSTLSLVCPIDHVNGLAPKSAIVNVLDQTTNGQVCCRLEKRSADGGTSWVGPDACTSVSGFSSSGTELTLQVNPAGGTFSGGTEFIFCGVNPQQSNSSQNAVNSYRFSE